MKKSAFRSKFQIWPYILTAVIVIAIVAAIVCVLRFCKVKAVIVDGNIHYTDEMISNMVMDGPLGDNTIYLYLKYRDREIKDVPFIETMTVSIESRDTIRITVYEKSLAGYVEYMDRFIYFDRTGTVVESSQVLTAGIPMVTGLKFDHCILYEPLPVEDMSLFEKVLDISQLMDKYNIEADRIHFTSDSSIILFFGDIEILIGNDEFIDEKVMAIPGILEKLPGKSGYIDLSDYSDGDTVTFEKSD
ncbi:MAG: FtsQ-type POTRA domain-containing protein [Lachnospiraceae bacterium]|nr:FtsQ-type POTRA domain-containing protein [Lachnospiraceae bacterium]